MFLLLAFLNIIFFVIFVHLFSFLLERLEIVRKQVGQELNPGLPEIKALQPLPTTSRGGCTLSGSWIGNEAQELNPGILIQDVAFQAAC